MLNAYISGFATKIPLKTKGIKINYKQVKKIYQSGTFTISFILD